MSFTAIEGALQDHLAANLGGYRLRSVGDTDAMWADEPHLRATFAPLATAEGGQQIGVDAPIREEGTFQIGVVHPVADGPAAVRSTADRLTAAFRRGVHMTAYAGGQTFSVRVVAVSRGALLEGDGLLSTVVNVSWRCWRPADT